MRRRLIVLLALVCALAACGRVGPPVRSRPKPRPTPAVQPAAAPTPAAQPAAAPTPAEQNEQTEEEEKP